MRDVFEGIVTGQSFYPHPMHLLWLVGVLEGEMAANLGTPLILRFPVHAHIVTPKSIMIISFLNSSWVPYDNNRRFPKGIGAYVPTLFLVSLDFMEALQSKQKITTLQPNGRLPLQILLPV